MKGTIFKFACALVLVMLIFFVSAPHQDNTLPGTIEFPDTGKTGLEILQGVFEEKHDSLQQETDTLSIDTLRQESQERKKQKKQTGPAFASL